MATSYTSAITRPAIATTGIRKRTVADKIRRLFPQDAQILALVANGLDAGEDVVRKKGLISKKKVESRTFEGFTYSPQAVEFTVTTGGTSSCVVSSATGLTLKTIVVNTNNMLVGRVSAISTNTLTITTVGGTSFESSAGDVLLSMGPAYAENSSSPYIYMKDEDNYYNTTHIFRFPAAISRTAKKNPHYGNKDFWSRVRQNVLAEGLRRVENALLFGERPSSGETTSDSTLSDTFGTFRGMWNWAATSKDFGGNMTWEGFQVDLPNAMHESVSPSEKKIMLCGEVTFGRMLRWVNDKLTVMESDSEYKEFGVFTKSFVTAKGNIEVIVHDAFNRGQMTNKALVFVPDRFQYCHFNDDDLKPKLGIQANDVDGVEDDILGELSCWSEDAGYSITKVTGIY